MEISQDPQVPKEVKSAVASGVEIFIPLAGLVDFDQEIARLEKELAKWQGEIDRVEGKLANEKFVNNAPEKIVQEERDKGVQYQERYEAVKDQLSNMREMKEG